MNVRITSKSKGEATESKTQVKGGKQAEKKLTAEDIAENIRQGLAEVKLIQEGKLKGTTLKDLLNEL